MHMLFYRQAVYKRSKNHRNSYLSSLMGKVCFINRDENILHHSFKKTETGKTASQPSNEQRTKEVDLIYGIDTWPINTLTKK